MSLRILSAVCCVAIVSFNSFTSAQDAAGKPADTSTEAVVKLLDAGSEPRKAIRFMPKKGDKQTAVMTMKMEQSVEVAGQKIPPFPTPTMQFTIDVEVTDVAKNGDISLQYVYPKAGVVDEGDAASPAQAAVEGMLKSVVGMKGTGVLTSRGFTKSSEIELPADAAPQLTAAIGSMKESLAKISSPVPEEPIGVGGKWSVTQTVTANGLTLEQTTIHTLKAINGNSFDLGVELTQSAEAQEVKAPGLPPGSKMMLSSLDSTGTGKMLLTTNQMFPSSDLKTETKSKMELSVAGQVQPMSLEMTMNMSIEPPK